jgi:signal peptidase II
VTLGLKIGESFPVWPGVFHLTLVNNTGAAFGLWHSSGVFLAVFSAVSFFFIVGLLLQNPKRAHAFAWALIAGGALGNLADRLAYGHVIDYLDFRVWPVFNLADACICLGVTWILFRLMTRRPKAPSKSHASDSF